MFVLFISSEIYNILYILSFLCLHSILLEVLKEIEVGLFQTFGIHLHGIKFVHFLLDLSAAALAHSHAASTVLALVPILAAVWRVVCRELPPHRKHRSRWHITSFLELLSHLVADAVPVRTHDDDGESNIEDDACNTEAEPEADDSHASCESEDKCQWHTDDVITEQSVKESVGLEAEATDDARLYAVDRVEPDVNEQDPNSHMDDTDHILFLGKDA